MLDSLIGQTIGNYQIVSEIGRGGMAIVYKAFQTSLNRYVAIKVLPPYFQHTAEFLDRFKREALAAAQMQHPNIVQIYETGEWNGYHYIVMEYVDGESLHTLMQKRGALDLTTTFNLIAQIGSALDYAHAQGIVHRDVKPSNILVDQRGRALLTDFGIAKAVESTRLTHTGTSLGTPEYMAPEQAEGEPVDARTDLYSLGVILYQMLTGRIPFGGPTPSAIMYGHVHKPPPAPHTLNAAVPPAVESVLLKALAKRREDRFQSASEMVAALRNAMAGKPVTPPPIPIGAESTAKGRSNSMLPIVVGGAIGLMVLLCVALVASLAQQQMSPTVVSSPTSAQIAVATSPTPVPVIQATRTTNNPVPPTAVVIVVTATPVPATLTSTPTRTPTHTPTITPSPTPAGPEGMVLIPAGVFWMGAAEGDTAAQPDEKPGMWLTTPAYWIDKFEVTVGQYKRCVDAGKCDRPSNVWSPQNPSALFGNPNLAAVQDYPITFVSHGNASQYCVWLGKRLPYEYEWEKAARGPYDARIWPWGNTWDGYKANAAQGKPGPLVVTQYSNPADPQSYGCGIFGVCNLIGNVREWVADYYHAKWYTDGYRDVHPGTVGTARPNWNSAPHMVIKGGSYKSDAANARIAKRFSGAPAATIDDVGFRCAMDAK
jgi:serine/threonine protein kinase